MSTPPLADLLSTLRVVRLPLRTRFRGVTEREIAYISGPVGVGEFAPFLEYEPVEASRWLASAIEAAYVGWPDPVRATIPVNATIPAVSAAEVPGVLHRYDGCTTAKIKVAEPGQTLQDDLDRVAAVRDAMGARAKIRVDANGGWSVDQAADALGKLAVYDLEYAEQPCATVEELRDLRMTLARNGIDVRVAADESIRKAEDPIRVAQLDAADVVVVKVAPLAGVQHALDVVAECGLPAVVSSALDSSVGIRAGLALAAALPQLEHACGLGTLGLFEADVVNESLVPVGGAIALRDVEPDPELLERYAAPAGRQGWWRERVGACHEVLRSGERA
ncbi:o-succinylbenzoate synthase [Demetria terragena]|uniref:o-succinylbenzoate synthase n=1 Tax=Demetria terragena TaxID=63959 RepID=UPI00035D3A44|nr:o-succinylbenzoate synthase [Demetria terragena]